uniref:Uncharacterized protein n=1 Tax=Daucus carota subsp. sativus TaxID=79200 RepID=A0A161ZRQ0_DAUCS
MDLLRHRLNDHQHQHVAAQAPTPPPPPVNNGMPGDESTDDELINILDPPPALGEPVAAVPPQGLPQNGPVVDGHAVNEPPQVQPPVENGHAANDRVANGAHD